MSNYEPPYERLLQELSEEYGILPEYWDIRGHRHETSDYTRQKLLGAMGIECSDAETAGKSLAEVRALPWKRILEPVVVCREGDLPVSLSIRLPESYREGICSWRLLLEGGGEEQGELDLDSLDPLDECEIEDQLYLRYEFVLPVAVSSGYHDFLLSCRPGGETAVATGSSSINAQTAVIVAPDSCYLPPRLESGEKLWGVSAQLYSIRSQRNWGIGDFSDLSTLIDYTRSVGGDLVGLNPLHCVSPRGDSGFSPYSPTTRFALNPLYIDIDQAVSFLDCEDTASVVKSGSIQKQISRCQETELVDYRGVPELKFQILEMLYAEFCKCHLAENSERAEGFKKFVHGQGERLRDYTLFAALQEHFSSKDPSIWGWFLWPEEYKDPDSEEVEMFYVEHLDRVQFYQFVEWLADIQLLRINQQCVEQGLGVGLYLDLALGASAGGADSWYDQELYCFGVSMGAPPDELAPQGQDWGLPPINPHRLREARYRQFIQVLRSTMRYGGAVRLDHVMSLMRLFWVPGPGEASQGAYVSYPLDELTGILALESQRNKCLVIGEDLGTVPNEVREAMSRSGVLSYKVLYFMKDYSSGEFLRPEQYPEKALVVTATHDLATLIGFWEGKDLEVRSRLKLHEQSFIEDLSIGRVRDRFAILKILSEVNGSSGSEIILAASFAARMPRDLQEQIHSFLAQTPCQLQVVQLEDVVGEREQANLPGTTTEHPNWRQKLSMTLEEFQENNRARRLLELVDEKRRAEESDDVSVAMRRESHDR